MCREACRNNGVRGATAVLLAAVLFGGSAPVLAQGRASSEYDVKAAFLFHFAQFVEWPEGTFRDTTSPLLYCMIGEDPFQGALDASFKGKTIGAHALQVKHLKEMDEAQGCQVVFLGKLGKRSVPEELARLKGTPVLTVGETEQFVKENGMIGFCLEDNKIRFEINLESAERAKLKISARLLALAKAVIGKPKRD